MEREEREPSKALGCNFSRYIRDESRNDWRKEERRWKSAEPKGKWSPANFREHRDHGIVLLGLGNSRANSFGRRRCLITLSRRAKRRET